MQKTIFNGDGDRRNIVINANVVAILLMTILLGLGGWGLLKITNMSDAFAQKSMVTGMISKIEKDLECARIDLKTDIISAKNEADNERSKIEQSAEKERVKLETRLEKRIDRLEEVILKKFQEVLENLEHASNRAKSTRE